MLSTILMCIGIWQIIKWVIGLYGAMTSDRSGYSGRYPSDEEELPLPPAPARAREPHLALARGSLEARTRTRTTGTEFSSRQKAWSRS
jgi:hypothetical protein